MTSDTPRGPKQLVWAHTPDAEFKFLLPPQGPEGLYGAAMPYPSLFIFGNGGAFGHEASDEKVIKIMQIQNEILADRDLFNTLVYGMEGVHWDRGPEGEIKIKVEEAKQAITTASASGGGSRSCATRIRPLPARPEKSTTGCRRCRSTTGASPSPTTA